jgi:hypothetical protein
MVTGHHTSSHLPRFWESSNISIHHDLVFWWWTPGTWECGLASMRPTPLVSFVLPFSDLKGICLRGNNKVVIILFLVHNRCLFLMLELY